MMLLTRLPLVATYELSGKINNLRRLKEINKDWQAAMRGAWLVI